MKKKLFLLVFFFSLLISAKASNFFLGGEITWECLSNGKYVFTMKIYRDCHGSSFQTTGISLQVSNSANISSIPMNYIFPSSDLSPKCYNTGPHYSCGTMQAGGTYGSSGSGFVIVEELIFKSYPILLAGIPGPDGWVFSWTNCCRNAGISNLPNPSSSGMTIRAKMFRYTNPNGSGKNEFPCFDSSPQFAQKPQAYLCSGYPSSFSNLAYDKDLDSLVYSWGEPLDLFNNSTIFTSTIPPVLPFDSGYSYSSPLPNGFLNPADLAAHLDSSDGTVTYTSFTQGVYTTVTKVSAYKNRQKVAEIYREIPVWIIPCGMGNLPPHITPPFAAGTSFDTTVAAGALVSFNITATDTGMYPGSPPIPHAVGIFAAGDEFDTTSFSASSVFCNQTPCAGLSPANISFNPISNSLQFNWQTDCAQLLTSSTPVDKSEQTFLFLFRAQDDFCPVPASEIRTVKIIVKGKAVLVPPQIQSTSVNLTGDVTLKWTIPIDSTGTFNSYFIYASSNFSGPYTLVDSIFNYTTDSLVLFGTTAKDSTLYFYMQSRSGCLGKVFSHASDTVNTSTVGVMEINSNDLFSLRPNPAAERFSIYAQTNANIKMYDTRGNEIFMAQIHKGPNHFETKNFENGTYTLQLNSSSILKVFKLVIIH